MQGRGRKSGVFERCKRHIHHICAQLPGPATMLSHNYQTTQIPQILVQLLFPQHGNEGCKQGDRETNIYEPRNLAHWIFPNRWSGGDFTWDNRPTESELDHKEEGHRLLIPLMTKLSWWQITAKANEIIDESRWLQATHKYQGHCYQEPHHISWHSSDHTQSPSSHTLCRSQGGLLLLMGWEKLAPSMSSQRSATRAA